MIQPSRAGKASSLDLSERAKFRITGTDRFRFLNGQITNDLRKVSETVAIEACVLNAKGKMDAHIFVGALGESFLVDAETGVREKLRARLERYIIADDVEIQDVTNQFSLFHVLSPESPTAKDSRLVSARRFTEQGCDIWSDRAHHDALLQQLSSTFAPLDSAAANIIKGISRLGHNARIATQNRLELKAVLDLSWINGGSGGSGAIVGGGGGEAGVGKEWRRMRLKAIEERCLDALAVES